MSFGKLMFGEPNRRTTLEQYVGLDVSLEETSICVMDRDGRILQRGVSATEPEAIAAYVRRHASEADRIVLETGQLSIWLTRELVALGLPVVCVDARLAHKALSGRRNKSDRHDAEGLAHLARTGWYNEVQIKSRTSDERRTLLGARDRTIRVRKDLEGHIRGVLKIFGIKLGKIAPGKERIGFRQRVHEVIDDDPTIKPALNPLLTVHAVTCKEEERLDALIRKRAKNNKTIQLLMTAPGVGAIVASAFVAVIDDPNRFTRSSQAGAYVGLTPRRFQSGEVDYSGRISKWGDPMLRAYLYEAALTLLTRGTRFSPLKSWGLRLQQQKGFRKAAVAVARKLATILFSMWRDNTEFRWSKDMSMAA